MYTTSFNTIVLFSLLTCVLCVGRNTFDKYAVPIPYDFGYEVKGKHGHTYRQETGDGKGGVRGSYGYTDAFGIYRKVEYIADKFGFRATIKSNEPGLSNENPASVYYHVEPAPASYYLKKT